MYRKKWNNQYFRFMVYVLLFSSFLTISAITFIIYYTSMQASDEKYREAFSWQLQEKGVVGLTDRISRAYKEKFTDYIATRYPIDTLLFGSSTAMSVTSDMLPGHTMYNSAKNSNSLSDSISKAEYYLTHFEYIKYIVIGFDWALGKPYQKYIPLRYEPKSDQKEEMNLLDKIKDAMSYQRVKMVVSNLSHRFLYQPETYKCPTEDNIGTDAFFIPMVPGNCHGYRFDGSATFLIKVISFSKHTLHTSNIRNIPVTYILILVLCTLFEKIFSPIKHNPHISNVTYIPIPYILIEATTPKHIRHICNFRYIPIPYWLVKYTTSKHSIHISNTTNIPITNWLVK